jgi:diaminopimelate decarboxylase
MEELDFLEEISSKLGCNIPIGIRICPPKDNNVWSRFGIQIETGEVGDAFSRIKRNPLLNLMTVHFHLGTQIDRGEVYIGAIKQAKNLWDEFQLGSEVHLDIGGGFPYQHDKCSENQEFKPINFFSILRNAWGDGKRPVMIIEPGRFIAAPSLMLVSKVLAIKQRMEEPTIVVLDSGTNHNVMAAFFEHEWHFSKVSKCKKEFRLCGPLCMEDDILSGPMSSQIPIQSSLAVMLNAGAYSLSLSRTFIQPRPPIISFIENGKCELLVPRENITASYALFPQSNNKARTHQIEAGMWA